MNNRKLTLVLMISLGLNVLFGGMWAGHLLQPEPKRDWMPKPDTEILSQLPPEKQQEFTRVMDGLREKGEAMHLHFKEMRKETLSLLKVEPFDKKAYRAHVEKTHQLRSEMMQEFSSTIETLAGTWTLDERKVLAKLLQRPPGWWKRCPPEEEKTDAPTDVTPEMKDSVTTPEKSL